LIRSARNLGSKKQLVICQLNSRSTHPQPLYINRAEPRQYMTFNKLTRDEYVWCFLILFLPHTTMQLPQRPCLFPPRSLNHTQVYQRIQYDLSPHFSSFSLLTRLCNSCPLIHIHPSYPPPQNRPVLHGLLLWYPAQFIRRNCFLYLHNVLYAFFFL
jgi:hypothetical protein